jgi:hypothetical protein
MKDLFKSFAEELELRKARDPFTDFPSKQAPSAKDAKDKEITDKMRERAGRQGTLDSDVKAGKRESSRMPTCGNDEKSCDMDNSDADTECQSCHATIHNIASKRAFKDHGISDNHKGPIPDKVLDSVDDHFERLQEMPKKKLYALHHKMFNYHMFDKNGGQQSGSTNTKKAQEILDSEKANADKKTTVN